IRWMAIHIQRFESSISLLTGGSLTIAMAALVSQTPEMIASGTETSSLRLNIRREILYTYIGVGVSLSTMIMVIHDLVQIFRMRFDAGRTLPSIEDALLIVVFVLLGYGNLVYQAARLGYFKRLRRHSVVERSELEAVYDLETRPLAVLIP